MRPAIENYLNTSHVILYQGTGRINLTGERFKYISCYSLSPYRYTSSLRPANLNTSHVILYQTLEGPLHASPGFKYISCYSLSKTKAPAVF